MKTWAAVLASWGIAGLTALMMIIADAPTWGWLGLSWVVFLIVWLWLVMMNEIENGQR